MKTTLVTALGLVVVLCMNVRPAHAQGKRGNMRQNNGAAAGAMQGGGQQMGARADAAQESGQLAQLMLANFDQNGDAALNLVELRAALDALLQRMRMNRQQGQENMAAANGQGAMDQVQRGQANGQAGAEGERHAARPQGNRGGGGGKGGRGR